MFERVETVKGDRFCEGIIISPDRIFIYRCPSFYLYSPVYIFFRRRKIAEKLLFKLKKLPSKIIKNPTWTHLSGDFYYLTLDKPLKSSSRHTPICISNYIPKENISKPVYFNWDEKLYQITGNSIWGKLHYTRISKKSKLYVLLRRWITFLTILASILIILFFSLDLRSAGVSYLKDDKWYLAGINRINSHGKNEYYSLDGRIPLSCMKKKDEICKELK